MKTTEDAENRVSGVRAAPAAAGPGGASSGGRTQMKDGDCMIW